MTAGTLASWLLEQESRALLTRLEGITPFAIHETMVPAANLSPAAQLGIERTIADGRTVLHRRVLGYLNWLRGPGRTASPADQQRRFVVLRLQFNNVLSQFDLFTEVVTQRSEHGTGVWLSGLDVLAADALHLPGDYFVPPAVACYLARGPGAAIRRARTRLPGGASNPIAIVKVPRERMVGHGIASSLVHEVGHQAAALLSLVPSLRFRLQAVQRGLGPAARAVGLLRKLGQRDSGGLLERGPARDRVDPGADGGSEPAHDLRLPAQRRRSASGAMAARSHQLRDR